jgi:hypothetical protein
MAYRYQISRCAIAEGQLIAITGWLWRIFSIACDTVQRLSRTRPGCTAHTFNTAPNPDGSDTVAL